MLDGKCLRCSQSAIVTKFPLRTLFLLPNRVPPKLRAVMVEARLCEPQASTQPLKLTGGSGRLTCVVKVSSKRVHVKDDDWLANGL